MALQIFGTNSIGTGTRADLSTTDDVLIASGATVASTDGYAVFGTGSGHSVDVQGTVAGQFGAIGLGNNPFDTGQHVVIGENGYASTADTSTAAVTIEGTNSKVDNAGTIHGESFGLRIGGSGLQNLVSNSGLIDAGNRAIQRIAGTTDILEVNNSGEIRAVSSGILTAMAFESEGQAIDRIYNSGVIVGDIFLGDGNDIVDSTGGEIIGTVLGQDGADQLTGGNTNDNLNGGNGNDILSGGLGDDNLSGGADSDVMSGGAGNDTMLGGGADDGMFGEAGNDSLVGGDGVDQMYGGDGDDNVNGEAGNDIMYGGAGNDSLLGAADVDQIDGGDGNDTVDAGTGSDIVSGGNGNDTLFGGTGNDTMSGGAGNDTFYVDAVGDVVNEVGGSGIDLVSSLISFNFSDAVHAKGALENLTLTGNAAINGTGNALANAITGNIAANILSGLAGNDVLNGGGGGDRLMGGLGNDVLRGQDGLDRLHGGAGNDTLASGTGADTFVFDTALNSATNRDVITDFVHGQDKFFLENAVFAKVGAAGVLQAGAFYAGPGAHDPNDRIVYNKASGALSYDADGTGAGAAIQFAVLANKPVLTATDFVVI